MIHSRWFNRIVNALPVLVVLLMFTGTVWATTSPAPTVSAAPGALDQAQGLMDTLLGSDNATTVQVMLLLTILSLAPSILIMFTAFTRIIIVLSFTRNAMGTMTMPPNQVLVGLALFLTFLVMAPFISTINDTAYQPLVRGEVTQDEAVELALQPLSEFMLKQVYAADLNFFINISDTDPDTPREELPMHVLAPAYITSEIKHAFEIGFMIYIPFIVIDMVVASTLLSMGMMMLPPSMISLPFKILLFILVDGWQKTIGVLITSFQ